MNYRPSKKDVLTIPNMLSFLRLALIPFIIWTYCVLKNYYVALGLLAASAFTDVIDGRIARRFNMVSDFGKLLDPVADKLTQATMILCVFSRYRLILILVILFVIKESMMLICGYIRLKKTDVMSSANWYGKLNTVMMYIIMSVLMVFTNIPLNVANILIIVCAAFMTLALIMYLRFYIHLLCSTAASAKESD